MALGRRAIFLGAGAYLAAVLARWPFYDVSPHTPEGAHYHIARTLASKATNVFFLYDGIPVYTDHLFWGRPLYFLGLAPGAFFGFEGMRIWHLLVSATLAPLVLLTLSSRGVHWVTATAAALVAALHPYMAVWSTLVVPDAWAIAAFLLGWLLLFEGKLLGAGAAFVASVWIKEITLVPIGALFLVTLFEERRAGTAQLYPLRLTPTSTMLALALVLGAVPLLVSLQMGALFPGWGRGGEGLVVVNRIFLTAWMWPLLLGALWWPRSRNVAAVAIGMGAFYVAYRFVLGRAIEIWYHIVPATLGVVAVFLLADELAAQVRERQRAPSRIVAAATLLFLVLMVPAALPSQVLVAEVLGSPIGDRPTGSYREVLAFEQNHGRQLEEAAAHLANVNVLLAIDVDWSDEFYPLGAAAGRVVEVRSGWVERGNVSLLPWADTIESTADATIVQNLSHPMTFTLRTVYAECITFDNGRFFILRGAPCSGRGEQLEAEFAARRT